MVPGAASEVCEKNVSILGVEWSLNVGCLGEASMTIRMVTTCFRSRSGGRAPSENGGE